MTEPNDPVETLLSALEHDPELARTVAHDLAAIADGRPTRGNYTLTQWWQIRRALAHTGAEQLNATLGTTGTGLE